MHALIVSADQFEDCELLYPFYRLREDGAAVTVAAPAAGRITGKHGYTVTVDAPLAALDTERFDLLVLPGGKAPAALVHEPAALAIARAFVRGNRPVAAICHGPQVLAAAGVLAGRHVTAYHTVADDLRRAGAFYEDRAVVVDGALVTSRQPADLPDFMRALRRALEAKSR